MQEQNSFFKGSFLSQTSRDEKQRRVKEKSRRKKIQLRERSGKSQNTVAFQFVGREGRKVGSSAKHP